MCALAHTRAERDCRQAISSFRASAHNRVFYSIENELSYRIKNASLHDGIILDYTTKGDVGRDAMLYLHGNQFSIISQIQDESSRQLNIIFDRACLDAVRSLYLFIRLIASFRAMFRFCCIFLSSTLH